jgi:hypothetical protein
MNFTPNSEILDKIQAAVIDLSAFVVNTKTVPQEFQFELLNYRVIKAYNINIIMLHF